MAFFAAMYFSALRPGEATTLRKSNLPLPAEGWGELLLEASTPEAGASWTDSGRRREERQLKHRAHGETRVVPSPPELTVLLHEHLAAFGTGPDGLLFRGVRGGELAESTYSRVWRKARIDALTPERGGVAAGSPALRPAPCCGVDLAERRACPPTQVAEWAGHSVAVLLQIYAKCIVGQEDAARRRIDAALAAGWLKLWRVFGADSR